MILQKFLYANANMVKSYFFLFSGNKNVFLTHMQLIFQKSYFDKTDGIFYKLSNGTLEIFQSCLVLEL